MFLFPLQILLANIQNSKSSLLALCHIPTSQPNMYTSLATKMKSFNYFLLECFCLELKNKVMEASGHS